MVTYNTSRMELSELQILACLAITEAMKMTPTAAMEAIVGFPPLNMMTETEDQIWIYRLMCNQQWRPKCTMAMLKTLRTRSMNAFYKLGLGK
jgi:hypothetical protein